MIYEVNISKMKSRVVVLMSLWFISLQAAAQIKYGIPDTPWPESYGNHRAVLEISQVADVVGLDLSWRRHDLNPDERRFIITEAISGDTVSNIYRYTVNDERCVLAFGPIDKPGTYFFYYLPYEPVYDQYHAGPYLDKEASPQEEWIRNIGLTGDEKELVKFPGVSVMEIQARTAFHSFYPMEVMATASEVNEYLEQHGDPYLVFPEDRSRPIKMPGALPYHWVQHTPSDAFHGVAQKNEYYAMQLGVYASKVPLQDLKVSFSDLSNDEGQTIPASSITCFNTDGVDIEGKPFSLKVDVEKGRIQPLWIGIDIPAAISPGKYQGMFTVYARDQVDREISIVLDIENKLLADRGDGETWRHSRLRWLNSTIGIDDEPVRPYTPLLINGKTISCFGREIVLNDFGFPAGASAWDSQILATPVRFSIESDNRIIQLTPQRFSFTRKENGIVGWEAVAGNDEIKQTCYGEIEFDGRMSYRCTVYAKKQIHLQDIRLEIPFKKEMATYMIGMGRMGGFAPAFHKSRWRKEEDSFWLGNTKGGIHCELRGGSYHGPLLNLYQPEPPDSWYNGVNGGFRIDTYNDVVTATAYSGYRPMQPGQEVTYEFAFIITPVKPYDPDDQFKYRYEHSPHPREEVVMNGGNVMNVHHANEYNPYINYPFIANEQLKGLVDHWHARDWKVKIYYTVRELSNHLTEIWALRSLGFEVLADGPGGGYQWLQEHLVDHYRYQWYTHLGGGTVDAAILNSGESRWYNYYLEGLAWLLREIDIDGLYLDDFSFDRRILKRMRKIMEDIKPGECLIDVHSNTAFSRGPANQYLEVYPYINRTWYGEGFNFDLMPADFWLSEVSGIPFGVVNELLLHRSVNKGRRGMLYAMVPRGDWGMWKFWDEFGIEDAEMIGYWDEHPPVKTSNDQVYATTYIKDDKALIVLASWLNEPATLNLEIDWSLLGLNKETAKIKVPQIQNYQERGSQNMDEPVSVSAKGVKFLVVSE